MDSLLPARPARSDSRMAEPAVLNSPSLFPSTSELVEVTFLAGPWSPAATLSSSRLLLPLVFSNALSSHAHCCPSESSASDSAELSPPASASCSYFKTNLCPQSSSAILLRRQMHRWAGPTKAPHFPTSQPRSFSLQVHPRFPHPCQHSSISRHQHQF